MLPRFSLVLASAGLTLADSTAKAAGASSILSLRDSAKGFDLVGYAKSAHVKSSGLVLAGDKLSMTVGSCTDLCIGKVFAAVFNTSCYCGDASVSLPTLLPLPAKTIPCPGNASEACGATDKSLTRRTDLLPDPYYSLYIRIWWLDWLRALGLLGPESTTDTVTVTLPAPSVAGGTQTITVPSLATLTTTVLSTLIKTTLVTPSLLPPIPGTTLTVTVSNTIPVLPTISATTATVFETLLVTPSVPLPASPSILTLTVPTTVVSFVFTTFTATALKTVLLSPSGLLVAPTYTLKIPTTVLSIVPTTVTRPSFIPTTITATFSQTVLVTVPGFPSLVALTSILTVPTTVVSFSVSTQTVPEVRSIVSLSILTVPTTIFSSNIITTTAIQFLTATITPLPVTLTLFRTLSAIALPVQTATVTVTNVVAALSTITNIQVSTLISFLTEIGPTSLVTLTSVRLVPTTVPLTRIVSITTTSLSISTLTLPGSVSGPATVTNVITALSTITNLQVSTLVSFLTSVQVVPTTVPLTRIIYITTTSLSISTLSLPGNLLGPATVTVNSVATATTTKTLTASPVTVISALTTTVVTTQTATRTIVQVSTLASLDTVSVTATIATTTTITKTAIVMTAVGTGLQNPGFELGRLGPWQDLSLGGTLGTLTSLLGNISPHSGSYAYSIGLSPAITDNLVQYITLLPKSTNYALSGWINGNLFLGSKCTVTACMSPGPAFATGINCATLFNAAMPQSSWTQMSATIPGTTSGGVYQLQISTTCALLGVLGTLYLDDFSLA